MKNGLKEASVEAGGQLGGRREGGNLGQGGWWVESEGARDPNSAGLGDAWAVGRVEATL